jgi:fructan beta-fructosidase
LNFAASSFFVAIIPNLFLLSNRHMKKLFLFSFILIFSDGFCQKSQYQEKYRPRFHFSPAANWCNDPNGLVYNIGVYHLFYQHNPFSNVWGHMTWAHAISSDLIHWKHLPIAIPEEKDTMIFSGSCVVDKKNTSGFAKKPGQVPMVAIYTAHIENVNQSQHLAYSLDNGITWTKYNRNPVLDLHKKDFRDPKVFWYEQKQYWVMALMFPVEHFVQFYSSENLKEWKYLSAFGPAGDTSGVWECPDLTQVPVEGRMGKKKWLLQMSMNGTMQYFVGEFDGVAFINENPVDRVFRPDYGPDYYAAIDYGQLPEKHLPVSIGWINNWNYANDIPVTPWKGAMSLPRTLSVKKSNDEWILIQKPVEKIKAERKMIYKEFKVAINNVVHLLPVTSQQCEIEASMSISNGSVAGLRIAAGNEHYLEFGYDTKKKVLYLDRSKTANRSFNKNFEKMSRYEIPYSLTGTNLKLRVFFDKSIVEVFINDGERVFTAQIFPDEKDNSIEFFNTNGHSGLVYCYVYEIRSAW